MGEVMDVVGQIELRREKGRFRLEEVWLGPLAVMRAAVYEPEGLVRRMRIAIVILPPRKMMGLESNGMLSAAVDQEKGEEAVHLLMVDDAIPAGAQLC